MKAPQFLNHLSLVQCGAWCALFRSGNPVFQGLIWRDGCIELDGSSQESVHAVGVEEGPDLEMDPMISSKELVSASHLWERSLL